MSKIFLTIIRVPIVTIKITIKIFTLCKLFCYFRNFCFNPAHIIEVRAICKISSNISPCGSPSRKIIYLFFYFFL